jgi:hypothetical protein
VDYLPRLFELGKLARDRMDRVMSLADTIDQRGAGGGRDEHDERGDQNSNHCLPVPLSSLGTPPRRFGMVNSLGSVLFR